MSYKAGIAKAITELKDRTGSSSISIKKHMQVRKTCCLSNIFCIFSGTFSPHYHRPARISVNK